MSKAIQKERFVVDDDQIVHLDGRELFRHGAPHSGAWNAISRERLGRDGWSPDHEAQASRLAVAYGRFLAANPAIELPGKFPIAWYRENAIRNGMRIADLPWESETYHRALRDPRELTEAMIPINYGATAEERAKGEQMQAVRGEDGLVQATMAGGDDLSAIGLGAMMPSAILPSQLRKETFATGNLPETFMTIKRWTAIPSEVLPILVGMGLHKAKSWGIVASQMQSDMLRMMILHAEQFSAWTAFEPEREDVRERLIALMLKIQREPNAAATFNAYYAAGGTSIGLLRAGIDSIRKIRTAIARLDEDNAKRSEFYRLPSTYCTPAIPTPQGVAWAGPNVFSKLSDMYGNCISRNQQGYGKEIAAGHAHVLYRTHRGRDDMGREGGMCCFIKYHEGWRRWFISQNKSFGNQDVHEDYEQEAKQIIDLMNKNPQSYLNLFRSERIETKSEDEFDPVVLRTPMPKNLMWGEDGLSFSVMHSLERNRTMQASAKDAVVVRRMRTAAIA